MRKLILVALATSFITAAGAAVAHSSHYEDYDAYRPDGAQMYGAQTTPDLWVYPRPDVEPHSTATGGPSGGIPGGN